MVYFNNNSIRSFLKRFNYSILLIASQLTSINEFDYVISLLVPYCEFSLLCSFRFLLPKFIFFIRVFASLIYLNFVLHLQCSIYTPSINTPLIPLIVVGDFTILFHYFSYLIIAIFVSST